MGGSRAEIGPGTRRVLLEAAWFSPMAVARTGSATGAALGGPGPFRAGRRPRDAPRRRSTASWPCCRPPTAGNGGDGPSPAPRSDAWTCAARPSPARRSVRLRTDRVNAILGTDLDRRRGGRICSSPSASNSRRTRTAPGRHSVRIPSWRLDCEREIDVIEEVARTWGYRRIERTIPSGAPGGSGGLTDPPAPGPSAARHPDRRRLRRGLDDHLSGPRGSRAGRPRSGRGGGGEPARPLRVDPAH